MKTRAINKFNWILKKENMWKFILPLVMYLIQVHKSFGMDNNQLCTIHLKPHEFIQVESHSKLRLICNQSLYETKLSRRKNQIIMEYSNKTSSKIDGNVQLSANSIYSCGSTGLDLKDDMKEIVIKDQPAPVKNFQCRSLDFQYWRCTFESTERMPTTYNLIYMINGHSYKCSCSKTNSLYECKDRIQRNAHDFYKFVLTSKNCFGARTETFNLTILDYVIPGRLKLSTGRVTGNAIKIHFEIDSKYVALYERGFDVKLKYKSEYDSSSWKKLKTLHISEGKSSIALDKLFPYTRYNVSMQVKAHNSIESFDMWRKSSIALRTLPAIPSRPPDIDQGGFYIDNNHCAHVYWKAVLKYEMGAEDFKYGVIITKDGDPISETTTTNYYYKNDSVCGNGEYVFSISSQNALGASNKSNVLRLRISDRNDSEDFPKPHQIKSVFNNDMYRLTWSSPKSLANHSLTNYTVFSCSAEKLSFDSCEDAIDFTHIPENRTSINFTNFENKRMMFAVSANYVNGSSGMANTLCIPHENADLRPLRLKAYATTNTTLKVGWALECEQRSLVVGYVPEYCRVDERTEHRSSTELCAELVENRTISHITPDETDFVLEGLQPFTKYRVQVAMISAMSRGPFSSVDARTSESAPSAPRNLRACRVFSDGATLQWELPEYPNGVIEHYDVLYTFLLNGSTRVSRIADGTNMEEKTISYNLTNLSSHSIYTIEVVAVLVLKQGQLTGAPSNKIIVRTRAGEPGEVRGSTAQRENSKVTVSWREPADIFGPSDTLYYEIKWSHGNKWQSSFINETSYWLEVDCEKSQLFQIHVRAINQVSFANDNITSRLCQCSTAAISEMYSNGSERLRYGKWLLVYESSCFPNFTLEILIVVASIIVLLSVYLLVRKHRKMKSIKLTVPLGLRDIYEESSQPLRPTKTNYSSDPVDTQVASKFVKSSRKFEMDLRMTTSLENENCPPVRGRATPTTLQMEQHISVRKHNADGGKMRKDAAIHYTISAKVNNQPIGKSGLAVATRVDVITERIENRMPIKNRITLLERRSQDLHYPNNTFLQAIELNASPPTDFEKESIIMKNLSFEHRDKSVKHPCDITTSIDSDYHSVQVSNKSSECEFDQATNHFKLPDGEKPSTGSIKSSDTRCVQNRQPASFDPTYVTMDQLVLLMRHEVH